MCDCVDGSPLIRHHRFEEQLRTMRSQLRTLLYSLVSRLRLTAEVELEGL